MQDVEFALESLFVSLTAFDHSQGIRVRCYTDQEPLLCSKHGLDSVRMNIRFELRINDFGSKQQGQFAQFRELTLLVVTNSNRCEFFPETPQTEVSWNVHDDDFVRCEEK